MERAETSIALEIGRVTQPRAWANLLLVLFSMALGIGLVEGWLHWTTPPGEAFEEERFWSYDPALGWTNHPGVDSYFQNPRHGYRAHVHFDELGLRSTGNPRPAQPRTRILLLGDSTSVGMEVDDARTYAALLETKLNQAGKNVVIYNAAVRGYGTDQSLIRLEQLLPRLKPDLVIYMACENDLQDNTTIKNWYRTYSKPVFVMAGNQLMTANSPARHLEPERYMYVDYERQGVRIRSGFVRPTGVWAWLRRYSLIYGQLEQWALVHLRNNAFVPQSRKHDAERKLFLALVTRMQQASPRFLMTAFTKERGGNVPGYDSFLALAEEGRIPFLDIRPFFHPGVLYDFKTDGHWNDTGHAVAAEALYELLKSRL